MRDGDDLAWAASWRPLALCISLFLWEIYSPDYGFRMPWLQVELDKSSLWFDVI